MRICRALLERPGATIAYEVTGQGPAIVFAHGLGGSELSWWQQVAAFRQTHTCITFSHRGFSPGPAMATTPDPADFAGDLAALADALQLASFTLVGQSMGGWTGVEFALAYPGRLSGLVLAATCGTIDPMGSEAANATEMAIWEDFAASTRLACDSLGLHVATGKRMASEQPALAALYQQIDTLNAGLDKEAIRKILWASRTRPATDLAAIDCPVLFIGGDEDAVFPTPALSWLAPHARRGSVAILPKTGHSGYFERADAFNALLRDFLRTAH